jgi:hypothetical protein
MPSTSLYLALKVGTEWFVVLKNEKELTIMKIVNPLLSLWCRRPESNRHGVAPGGF